MELENKIEALIQTYGASLYDTQTVTEFEETIFRILITHPKGVTLELCEKISKELSPLLDVYPPMRGAYRLEISSIGIERKLTKPKHFKQSIGELIKIKIEKDKYSGKIVSATNEDFTILKDKEETTFNYLEITSAKTYFEW